MTFSERHGIEPKKTVIQIDSIDDDLRNSLWSALKMSYWDTFEPQHDSMGMYPSTNYLSGHRNENLETLCKRLWLHFFKKPLDTLSNDWTNVMATLRSYFFQCKWNKVYDFMEYIAQSHPDKGLNDNFIKTCNIFLEKEVSGYRFVDNIITKIVSREEISSIEESIKHSANAVKEHMIRALQLLSDRKNPDYRNSIKESISAVEALARKITRNDKATLGDLLGELERKKGLHPALKGAFSKLYGYTSDENGIRHSLIESDKSTFEEAKFMLVACSGFINYVSGTIKN